MRTFSDQTAPTRCGITLDMAKDSAGPLDAACRILCDTYGAIDNTIRGVVVGGGPGYRAYQWFLKPKQVQEAFTPAGNICEEIPSSKERISVQAQWKFKFTDSVTGTILPFQDDLPTIDMQLPPGSSLSLSAGHKTNAPAWFLLPFEGPSPEFQNYAVALQKLLIFKFLPKHWLIWNYSKSGNLYSRHFVPTLTHEESPYYLASHRGCRTLVLFKGAVFDLTVDRTHSRNRGCCLPHPISEDYTEGFPF